MNAEMQCLSNSDFILCLVKIHSSTLHLIIKKEKRECMPKISLILAKYPEDPNITSNHSFLKLRSQESMSSSQKPNRESSLG